MSIFLKLPNIKGSVSTKGYEGTIELLTATWSSQRHIKQQSGMLNNRGFSVPSHRELVLTKHADVASCDLHQNFFDGKVFAIAEIYHVHSNQGNGALLIYTLHNVIVSYIEETLERDKALPLEQINLNFTKLEKKYTFSDEQGKLTTPKSVQYDFAQMV